MEFFLSVIGMVMVIEGIPYFVRSREDEGGYENGSLAT